MKTQNGIQLAIYLVSSHFGDLTAKVCECLLRKGTLTLAQIIRFTKLSRDNVRKCLLVLIHHNCVQAFASKQKGGFLEPESITTNYTAVFDNIIHRLRFPKFIEIVSKELGKDCEGIFEGLLQHGRMSINQIIDRQKQMILNQGTFDRGAILENFSKLANARFVERCPAPDPLVVPPSDDETKAAKKEENKAKKKKSKEAAMSSTEDSKVASKSQTQTNEHRAMVAAAPIKALRFLLDMDMDESSDASDEKSGKLTSPTGGEKRKLEYLESDGLLGHEEKKEVLWRANYEEFARRLRVKMCVAFVTSRVDEGAGIVLNAVLELIGQPEKEMSFGSEDLLPDEGDIYHEVLKNEAAISMDKDKVIVTLSQLESHMLVECKNFRFYSVDLNYLIKLARMEEVESIVLNRFGRDAFCIYRLLSKAGKLVESEKIACETFLDRKDAMKNLYTLWKGDYIQMEKVNVSQGGGVTQLSLWKVNEYLLREHVLDEMYHSALNLILRIVQEKKLLKILKDEMVGDNNAKIPKDEMVGDNNAKIPKDKMNDKMVGDNNAKVPKDKMVGNKNARFKRFKKVRFILLSSLMDLGDALILFIDF